MKFKCHIKIFHKIINNLVINIQKILNIFIFKENNVILSLILTYLLNWFFSTLSSGLQPSFTHHSCRKCQFCLRVMEPSV